MTGLDQSNLIVGVSAFLICIALFVISIIFTFFNDLYQRIDEKLNSVVIPGETRNVFERNIGWLDDWIIVNYKLVGPGLVLLSLLNAVLYYDILIRLMLFVA